MVTDWDEIHQMPLQGIQVHIRPYPTVGERKLNHRISITKEGTCTVSFQISHEKHLGSLTFH